MTTTNEAIINPPLEETKEDGGKENTRDRKRPKRESYGTIAAKLAPDPFTDALRKQAEEVPIFTQEELDRVQVDPLLFPEECLRLEEGEEFKFCWIPKPESAGDKQTLGLYHKDFGSTGKYVYVTRENMGHILDNDELFSESGAIERGDLALGVVRWEVWHKLRERDRHAGYMQKERSRVGFDSHGRIPNVMVDDGEGRFDHTVPEQFMMEQNDEGEWVEGAPLMHSDV